MSCSLEIILSHSLDVFLSASSEVSVRFRSVNASFRNTTKGHLVSKNLNIPTEDCILFISKGTKWEGSNEEIYDDAQVPYFLVTGSCFRCFNSVWGFTVHLSKAAELNVQEFHASGSS